jgi:hypothetical protein
MFLYMFAYANLVKSWDDLPRISELFARSSPKQRKSGCFQGALQAGGRQFDPAWLHSETPVTAGVFAFPAQEGLRGV